MLNVSLIAYSKMKPCLVKVAKTEDPFCKSIQIIMLVHINTWTTVNIAGEICSVAALTVTTTTARAWIGTRTVLGYHTSPTSCRAL